MKAPESPDGTWAEYFEGSLSKPLHPLYAELDKYLPTAGHAVELGCGVGHGVLHWVEKGFQVTAVDVSAEALGLLRGRLPAGADVDLVQANLEHYEVPACDVVVSGFTLFFLAPADLALFWARLVAALKPGGLFMGEFLGVRDDWASRGYTSHERSEVEAMLSGFEVLYFEEADRDGFTLQGTRKHWHIFHVVARKH